MMVALQAVTMVLVGVIGTAVVVTHEPLHQAMVWTLFGFAIVVLFLVFQAPDVSLSAVVVSGLAYPMMILLTVAKARDRSR